MSILNKKTKKIVKIVSLGVLLLSAAVGIIIKEAKNGFSYGLKQPPRENYDSSRSGAPDLSKKEANKPKVVCDDLLNEQGNDLILKEYGKTEIVNCFSVGCSGIF
ncbi:MAG: hypothetical protein PHT44_00670 [Candidatus Portnoybacteria bacterium]|nr:hypothetical protein [Candidatus Portnoybacteria bacterium]MDD4982872.1 hypothetical protein [Candidatus Portnoybacteria bacterium]